MAEQGPARADRARAHPISERDLSRYAEVTVKVGLGLLPGQPLLIRADVLAAPLVRAITRAAYEAGASLVTPLYGDEQVQVLRYRHAPAGSFSAYPAWWSRALTEAAREGAAVLNIDSDDPTLLEGQDPARVAEVARTAAAHQRPFLELISRFAVNWCIVAYPSAAWADQAFPDLAPEARVAALWAAIRRAVRLDDEDPTAAWQTHLGVLGARREALNARRLRALHLRGPGIDLRVGLADGHRWEGGAGHAENGALCVPNLPTEEVFTMPHRARVDGVATATRAFSLHGQLVEGMRVRFEGGRVVEARAATGEAALHNFLDTDEGARYLGEVALVPHSSPISASSILFYNTLYDENAASHLALGSAYEDCIEGGQTEERAALRARGMNDSMVHEDWMVGSGDLDVDGVLPSGTVEPLMRRGEWVSS